MTKYCIRDDGAVFPYSPALAGLSNFKIVDELPESHLKSIERSKGRFDERAHAAKAMRQAHDQRIADRKAVTQAVRSRIAEGPAVDVQAAAEAQRQADEFSGNVAAEPEAASEFVIGTASEEALRKYAKDTFGVTLHHKAGIDKLRAKVAELAGVKPE